MIVYCFMIRRPPRSTRTDTLFPYTTLCRSWPFGFVYQAAKIAAPAECRALVKIGRLKSEIAERSALEEASDEVLWIATFFDLSEPDKGIVAGKFGRWAERRVGKECVSTCRSRWPPCP